MIWILIPILGILILSVLSLLNYNKTKNYYLKKENELIDESKELKSKVISFVKKNQPNLENSIIVNGNCTKQVSIGLNITTYYSYVIIYNKLTKLFQVISYNALDNISKSLGIFEQKNINAVDINNGFQTNYIFKNESGDELLTVQTKGNEIPSEDRFLIKYYQQEEYNELRELFNLPYYSIKKAFKGE